MRECAMNAFEDDVGEEHTRSHFSCFTEKQFQFRIEIKLSCNNTYFSLLLIIQTLRSITIFKLDNFALLDYSIYTIL